MKIRLQLGKWLESHSLTWSLSLKILKESGLVFFIHKMEIIFLSQSILQGIHEALNGRMSVNHCANTSYSYQRAEDSSLKEQHHETTFKAFQTTLYILLDGWHYSQFQGWKCKTKRNRIWGALPDNRIIKEEVKNQSRETWYFDFLDNCQPFWG